MVMKYTRFAAYAKSMKNILLKPNRVFIHTYEANKT